MCPLFQGSLAWSGLLLDVKKAYPNVCKERCWRALSGMGVPKKMLQVIEMLHGSTTYEIHTKTEVSAPFELKRGIKERCPSSPVAFNLHHEIGLRRLKEGIEGITLKVGAVYQVKIEWRFQGSGRSPESPGSHKMLLEEIEKVTIKPLAFADDTIIPSTEKSYKENEKKAVETFLETQEYVHPGKTESLLADSHLGAELDELDKSVFLQEVKVLGAWIERDGGAEKDSDNRQQRAATMWRKIRRQLYRFPLSLQSKCRIIQAAVVGSLLYGAEVRSFKKATIARYQTFVDRCLGFIQFPLWPSLGRI